MEEGRDQFTLTVPLDASAIQDREGDQELKVIAKDRQGKFYSDTVKVGSKGKGTAKFQFKKHPGALHLAFGPADATDEELIGTQTLNMDVRFPTLNRPFPAEKSPAHVENLTYGSTRDVI